jgi:hypothetical protein
MEATRSSETSPDFQRTTQRYMAEESSLYNYLCKAEKSKLKLLP